MPELYSDSFLATVSPQTPDPVSPPPSKQPSLPLQEQIRNAVNGEVDMLAALGPSHRQLQVKFGDETDVPPTANTLNKFLLSPQKGNCNIAILYGTMNGNLVYVFLHEDSGTFPYKLTYHAFTPSTLMHVSEHSCSYMYESIGTQGQDVAFEPAKDASQVGALALYYFSHLKRLACTYPLMNELKKQLQVMCRSITQSHPHQASDRTQEREVRHPGANKENPVATQVPKKFGPKAIVPPEIQRGGLKPTSIKMAAASPRSGGRPHQKRPAPAQLGSDLGRKKRRTQADQENKGEAADLTRPDTGRTAVRTPRAPSSIEAFGAWASSIAGDSQATSSPTIVPAQSQFTNAQMNSTPTIISTPFQFRHPRVTSIPTAFQAQLQSRNPNQSHHAHAAQASHPSLGTRNTGGLTPGMNASRANNSFQARTYSSVSHTNQVFPVYPTTNYQLPNLHAFAGIGLIRDLRAAHEQEKEATTYVHNTQSQIVTARQDIAGMRNRYMELQAECARLAPAIAQADHELDLLEKHQKDLDTVATACRNRQRAIVYTLEPIMGSMI